VNPTCSTGSFPGSTLCFKYNDPIGSAPNTTLAGFLASGGATILSDPANLAGTPGSLANTVFEFTGIVTVTKNQLVQVLHDDGLQLQIGSQILPLTSNATAPVLEPVTYTGDTGTFPFDLVYGECCGGQADLVVSLPLFPSFSLPGTPDPQNVSQLLFNLDMTGPSDAKPSSEGGQATSECSNAPTTGGAITGIIPGNLTLTTQQCTYQNCEFQGNLTINGGSATITNCQVDGNINLISGSLSLADSTVGLTPASGNVSISPLGSFNIGPMSLIGGNVTIQGLPNTPTGIGPDTICSTQVHGNVTVQSSLAALQIGTKGTAVCSKNTIGGNLLCSSSPNVTSGGNTVIGSKNTCG
jgi:hypothetical protein